MNILNISQIYGIKKEKNTNKLAFANSCRKVNSYCINQSNWNQ